MDEQEELGPGRNDAPTSQAKYRPVNSSDTVDVVVESWLCASNAVVLASSSSGAFVLVGRSSRTKWSNGNNALSCTSITCFSSSRLQARYSHCRVEKPYSASDESKSLNVGSGLATICSTVCVAFGNGATAARAVHRATWSTGTIFTVLLMSGTSPSCTQPLTKRHMKSSVLVTVKRANQPG